MATKLHGEGGEAGDALRRVQEFDAATLVREAELGKKFAMREAVEPAKQVIDLFRLIQPRQVKYFPPAQQNVIRDQANAFYNLLEKILNFEIENAAPNPTEAKSALIGSLDGQFQPIFNQLFPLISFANIRSLDFSQLEREARAASQAAKDTVEQLVASVEESKESAEAIVTEVRALAAEQGVSKQAIHFKAEADKHGDLATEWRNYTLVMAAILIAYAVASLFFHHIKYLETDTTYGAIQVGISKILIFAVLAYLLVLSARNFLSQKHNEIVNRHRQNALATFTALAEATSDAASSDIVLSHAAACIFSPQETGYTKHESSPSDVVPALQIVPRVGQALSTAHGH